MLSAILAADSYVPRLLIGVVIGALVGGVIGNNKNRVGLGVVLGAILGCIGWIIMLVIPKKDV